jgi:Domain of unknown function (DUF4280)
MGSPHVCMGAQLQCMFGAAPSNLMVLPLHRTMTNNMLAANIMDNKPFVNIIPFGICNSPANPAAVAAKAVGATVPCTPVTPAPWVPGSPTVMLNKFPALNATSKLSCVLGGGAPCISVTNPGQQKEMIA